MGNAQPQNSHILDCPAKSINDFSFANAIVIAIEKFSGTSWINCLSKIRCGFFLAIGAAAGVSFRAAAVHHKLPSLLIYFNQLNRRLKSSQSISYDGGGPQSNEGSPPPRSVLRDRLRSCLHR